MKLWSQYKNIYAKIVTKITEDGKEYFENHGLLFIYNTMAKIAEWDNIG